jgi:hypothetical protein
MNITLARRPDERWCCDPVWFVWSLALADRYRAPAPGRTLPWWDPRRHDPYGISGRAWKFTDHEAATLADALNRALDDLSCCASRVPSTNLLEIFGGEDMKMFLSAMTAFCQRGAFEVL